MYYTSVVTNRNNTEAISVKLEGSDLAIFFCLEEGVPVRCSGRLGDSANTYIITKDSGDTFKANYRIVFYGLPENYPTLTIADFEKFLELLNAYTIYLTYFAKSIEKLTLLDKLVNSAPAVKVFDNSSVQYLPVYLGQMASVYFDAPGIPDGGVANKTVLVPKSILPFDSVMACKLEQTENTLECTRSLIIKHFFTRGNYIIIPNLTMEFKPTHFLRCGGLLASAGGIEFPIELEEGVNVSYKPSRPSIIRQVHPTYDLFNKQVIKDENDNVLNENDSVPTGLLRVDVDVIRDNNVRITYGGVDVWTNELILTPRHQTFPKLEFSIDGISNEPLFIRVHGITDLNVYPQQLATSGIETSNTTWEKREEDGDTIFQTSKPVNVNTDDFINVSVGWRL